jgi:hypothetical protein
MDSDWKEILALSQDLDGDPGGEVTRLRDEVFAYLGRDESRRLIEQIADLLEASQRLGRDELDALRPYDTEGHGDRRA